MELGIWEVGRRLGSGEFGVVCEAWSVERDKIIDGIWVIKYAEIKKGKNVKVDLLYHERNMYINLHGLDFIPQIPLGRSASKLYTYFAGISQNNKYRYVVMEKLDMTLEDYFKIIPDFKSLMIICYNLIDELKIIHSRKHIVNDIKSDNFMLKNDANGNPIIENIYFIDLGGFVTHPSSLNEPATIKYSGFNVLRGNRISYFDDIEAMLFMILEVLSPLPWHYKLKTNNIKEINEYKTNKLLYDIKSENNLLKDWLESINMSEFYNIFEDIHSGNLNYNKYLDIIENLI